MESVNLSKTERDWEDNDTGVWEKVTNWDKYIMIFITKGEIKLKK